jgi:hypothetical protein
LPMLELIVRLLPLIFFSSAIGIFLLNIRPIFNYFIYVISMAFQPKQLLRTTQQVEQKEANSVVYKFSFFTPFLRIWTLFRVLFLPDVDISSVIHKNSNSDDTNSNWMSSVYVQKTMDEAAGVKIKTYSVSGTQDTSHFRSSFEPSVTPPVSEEFAKVFPSLSSKTESANLNNNLSPEIKFYSGSVGGIKQI